MPTVTKTVPTGTIPTNELHKLHAETRAASVTLGAVCSRVRCEVDSPDDSLIFDFDVAPDNTALDNLIAAYPSTATLASSPIAVSVNTDYLLVDQPIGIGQQVLFDYRVIAAFGTVAASQPQSTRGSLLAWRNSTGNVQVALAPEDLVGVIPSFRVTAVGTATTARLSIRMGKAGTLTIGQFLFDKVMEMQL